MYTIDNLPESINIGKQGEGGILTLEFDCSAWVSKFPDGLISAVYIDPRTNAIAPIPLSQAYKTGSTFYIKVLHNLTVYAGYAYINIRLVGGSDIEKRTAMIKVYVEKGVTPSADMPGMVQDWVNDATELQNALGIALSEVEANEGLREAAEEARETAEGLRDEAEGLRGSAETSRNTAEGLRDSAETARREAEVLRIAAEAARMGFKPMGAYNPANENKYGEWYTHEGGSYGYIWPEPSTGVPLTDMTHWQQIASVGGQDILDAVTAEKNAAIAAKVLAEGYAAQLAAGTASPAGTYANLAALIAADPDHSKIYITLNDGNWCYHNGSAFVAGGVYQAVSVASALDGDYPKNLISGARDFSGDWINIGLWTEEAELFKGFSVYSYAAINDGLYKVINVPKGLYKFSAFVKLATLPAAPNSCAMYVITGTAEVASYDVFISPTTDWARYEVTIEITAPGTIIPRVELLAGPNTVYVCGLTLYGEYSPYEAYLYDSIEKIYTNASGILALNTDITNLEATVNAAVQKHENLLTGMVQSELYLHGEINAEPNGATNRYPIVSFLAGETIYYRNVWAYFCTIKYADNSLVPLSALDIGNEVKGSFVAAQNGVIGITVGKSVTGHILTRDKEMWDNDNPVTYYTLILPHTYHVEKDGSGDYVKISDAIFEAIKYPDSAIYLGAGSYDIIEELGAAYIDAISVTNRGLYLRNGVHIIGSSNSEIVCRYLGGNATVREWISIFNSGAGGFTLENVTLKGANLRYIIHDERDSDADQYTNKYIGCNMYLNNASGSPTEQCIGGGLGLNGNIVIDGCVFESEGSYNLVSYHNSAGANAKSHISVKNSYFVGATKGKMRVNYYGQSELVTQVEISGCSFYSAPTSEAETSDGSSPHVNVTMKMWNNDVRGA